MGLRQEAETSFGNQSDRPLPHPAVAGLSRFEARLSRRSIILGAATAGILAAVGIPLRAQAQVESPVDIAQDQEQLLSDAVTRWSTQAVKEEALGELFELTGMPLSWGFYDQVGYSKLFQSMLVSLDQDNNPVLRNLLTEEELNGFDTYNIPPFLGDAAPKKGVSRIPPPRVSQITAALSRVFGLPNLQITGLDSFAGYNSYRIGDETGDKLGLIEYTQGEEKGTIRMAHFASLAVQAGIVPQDMMLAYGELATGGGIPEINAELNKLKPKIVVPWDEKDPGKGIMLTIINGKRGFDFDPEAEFEVNKYDPKTFEVIKDAQGNLVKEMVKAKDILKTVLTRYEVPQFIIEVVDDPEEIISRSGYPVALYGTPKSRIHYAKWDWIARPSEYTNDALLLRIYFNPDETLNQDTPGGLTTVAFEGAVGSNLLMSVMQFKDAAPGTILQSIEASGPEFSRYSERLSRRDENNLYPQTQPFKHIA